MASERRTAIDTCVLVNVFTNGAGDDPAWLPESLKVLRHGYTGDYRLVASTLTIAEVAGTGAVRGTHVPAQERRKRIAKAREWIEDHRLWLLVELDGRLSRTAADLAIEHQLKGPDAVVLASAQLAKAESLVTWDRDLLKLNGAVDLKVCTPAEFVIEQEHFDDLV
jgi:predicted nucleic acid-binding protein